jgi:hypothetical protein
MACGCSNKRKKQLKEKIKRKIQEAEHLKIQGKMANANPASLSTKVLVDYHYKTHMLYNGNIKRKPVNKKFINSIVSLHNNLVKEMLKRNIKHTSPMNKIA